MNYRRIDQSKIEIDPEGLPALPMLLAIAKVSYDTATPRGMGHAQPFQAPSQEVCLEDYVSSDESGPALLLMDYISGRDCRTKVFRDSRGTWYFDSYAFQQRKVTATEFMAGIVRDHADAFLDCVIKTLEKR